MDERRRQVPPFHRSLYSLLFIDLEKAFDKVNRHRLVQKMRNLDIPADLTNAAIALMSHT